MPHTHLFVSSLHLAIAATLLVASTARDGWAAESKAAQSKAAQSEAAQSEVIDPQPVLAEPTAAQDGSAPKTPPTQGAPKQRVNKPALQETAKQRKQRMDWQKDQERQRDERRKQREVRARKAQAGEKYEAKVVGAYSSRPRMILGVRFGLHATSDYILDEDVSGAQVGIQWGVRWHFNERFGALLTAEGLIGNWFGETQYSAQGRVSSLRTQFAPYFRPTRRLMLGPTFAFGRNAYTVNRDRFSRSIATDNAWVSGFGLQVGWLTGREQNVMMTSGLMVLDEISGSSLRGNTVEIYGSAAFAF